ncbi:MAG: hypothetical protein Q8R26_03785 [bacterium]|nr:hypothetical protein [bacterium]
MEFLICLSIIAIITIISFAGEVSQPIVLAVLIMVVLGIYLRTSNKIKSIKPSFFKAQLSPWNVLIVFLLLIALIGLSERALYDIARIFSGPQYSYFYNIQTILFHSLFIIPVFIISIAINFLLGEKKERYAVALIPYQITSTLLIMQLGLQIMTYFYNNHTSLQLYAVLSIIAFTASIAIFAIQSKAEA